MPPAISVQDRSQDVSDPGSCPALSSQGRFVGSLTPWLLVRWVVEIQRVSVTAD